MPCPNCGTVNPEGAKFCRGCGRALAPASLAPPAQQATPVPIPASAAQPHLTTSPSRLGQVFDLADLLLALLGTGLGALAGILGNYLLPRLAPQFQLAPFALSVEVAIVAVLASALSIRPLVYWVFLNRASHTELKLKRLLQKDRI